jgi:hypothetical protein
MNAKMKVLALALLGLAGYAGSAVAGCPSSPVPPWSSEAQLGGGTVAISTGGLDGSACKMDAALGASLASVATVVDTTPANEVRYRFQFLFNADATGSFGATDGAVVFSANAAAAANGRTPVVQVGLTPGTSGAKRLTFVASCASGANFRCVGQTTDLPAGMNRIEVDLNVGADGVGYLKYWLNAAQGTATEPPETGSIAISGGNADWTGVDTGVMGLGSATPSYIGATGHAGQIVSFDTFDSRRATYIGW